MRFWPWPLFFLSTSITILCACGGGGGGDSFVGAAQVSIEAEPREIDSGDRMKVQVTIGEIHPSGIALKLRYPAGLQYVTQTAFLDVDGQRIDVSPTVNLTSSDPAATYLVFYLSQALFTPSGDEYDGQLGTLSLQLEGKAEAKAAKLEVDPDVDDPEESNTTEFKLSAPEFAAEDEVEIEVIG